MERGEDVIAEKRRAIDGGRGKLLCLEQSSIFTLRQAALLAQAAQQCRDAQNGTSLMLHLTAIFLPPVMTIP